MATCPRCGTEARILLNLAGCLTETCRNYDIKWANEWNSQNKPQFAHSPMGENHRFLGGFVSATGAVFDLYSCKVNNILLCLARYGNQDNQCYYIDSKETEIGIITSGAVASVSAPITEALKEALRRFRGK